MIKFFREYQKYLFWTIVLIVLPTFSISFVMLDVMTGPGTEPAGTAFGEEVDPAELHALQARRIGFLRFIGQPVEREYDLVWQHLVLLRKAEEVGVQVSDEAIAKRVKSVYRDVVATERAFLEVQQDEQYRALLEQFGPQLLEPLVRQRRDELLPQVAFKVEDYAERLKRVDLKPASFELALREQMMVERLLEAAENGAHVDPQALFEVYQSEHHKRRARYATFRGADFKPTRESASEDELKGYYEEHQHRYAEPRRVALDYLLIPVKDVEGEVAAPSEEDLQAAYERHKEARFKLPSAPPPPGGEGEAPPPAAAYRPFDEVKAELAKELVTERAKELAKKKADDLRAVVLDATAAGRRTPLGGLAMAEGALFGTTGLIEPRALVDVKPIRGDFLLPVKVQGLAAGEVSQVGTNDDNAYLYVVRDKREARDIPYDEVKDQVLAGFVDGHEDDVRQHYNRNVAKYREPERMKLEVMWKPHARFRTELPAELAGEERKKRLAELVKEDWESLGTAFGKRDAEGRVRDPEVVANERGWEYELVECRLGGEDLPKDLGEPTEEMLAWLAGARAKKDQLSETYLDKAETLSVGFRPLGLSAPRTPPLADIEARVRDDLRAERGATRARAKAKAFAEKVALRPASFEREAAALGAPVAESGLLARQDDGKGLPGEKAFVSGLFAIEELGGVSAPDATIAGDATVTVLRFVEREAASPEGFEAKREELTKRLLPNERAAARARLVNEIRLESHGLGDGAVKVGYELFLGPDGLDAIGFRHIFVEADQEAIEAAMKARAKERAEALAKELALGKLTFVAAALERSEDKETRRASGVVRNGTPLYQELDRLTRGLKSGEVSAPLETAAGYHLVRVSDGAAGMRRLQHILFAGKPERDPATGQLVGVAPELMHEAMAKAKAKIEDAKRRLDDGESFIAVAKAVGTGDGTWQETFYPYYTELERAALALGQGLKQGGRALDLLSAPIEHGGGAHLLYVGEASLGDEKALKVWHLFLAGGDAAKRLASIREDIVEDFEDEVEDEKSTSGQRSRLARVFERYAEERSEAATAPKGGVLGIVRFAPALERYGEPLRDAVYRLGAGERSGVIAGADGYHIVLVTERKTATYEKAWLGLAALLLEGLSYGG